jgi:hypothetical protein
MSGESFRQNMIASLVGIIFFLIGLGVLVSGVFSIFKIRRQVADSVKTTGTVFGFGKSMGKSGYIYCPQVAFTDAHGRKIQFESEVGAQPPAYVIGQQVQIIYQQNNPQKAEIDSVTSLWFVPGCTTLMGLAFTFLGLVLFIVGIFVHLNT